VFSSTLSKRSTAIETWLRFGSVQELWAANVLSKSFSAFANSPELFFISDSIARMREGRDEIDDMLLAASELEAPTS
jgi:hypothetical protein